MTTDEILGQINQILYEYMEGKLSEEEALTRIRELVKETA